MNPNLKKLFSISQKPERNIIGLMSGTSLDGLDVALCKISGSGLETKISIEAFETVDYNEGIKLEIKKVFSRKEVDLQHLCLLNAWIGTLHGEMINNCLKKWNKNATEIDIIASHGQTIFHAPKSLHGQEKFPNATLQIGDGDHITVKTGIITLSDFRQKHIAAGGEGAPLAVYGDYILFSKAGEDRIMLNIGGIANFTYLSGDMDINKMFSTDVGPGNTLIDAFIQENFNNKSFDKNGEVAASGNVNFTLLKSLKEHLFFEESFSKTTGPELFSKDYVRQAQQKSSTENISLPDLIATLTRFSAEGIADAVKSCFSEHEKPVLYLSGGGMHNPVLFKMISELLPDYSMKNTDRLGILPDAKEAVLFAILANEAISGGNTRIGNSRQGIPDISMGKISFPD
ncbi:anhydro-N-acetylmuramic acid kinase AnmK [soil metagenome]